MNQQNEEQIEEDLYTAGNEQNVEPQEEVLMDEKDEKNNQTSAININLFDGDKKEEP